MIKYVLLALIAVYCVWVIIKIKKKKGCCSCSGCPYEGNCNKK